MSTPSNRQIASRQVMRLRTIRKNLLDMADQWDGIDQFNMSQLTDLADQAETVATELIEAKSAED